jgi:SulP family sulfate permease
MKYGLNLKYFKNDLLGGVTAGIVALPLALAFGVSSGLGPSAGLYGGIALCFFAALFGGTPTQISGPTAPMTAVCILIISGIIASCDGDLAVAIPTILMTFFIAGIFQIFLGLIGIGKYVKYIPQPVISGFMTSIGLIIVLTQLLPALGYYPTEDTFAVSNFTGEAKELILHELVLAEAENGTLTQQKLGELATESNYLTEEEITQKSISLAKAHASGATGTLKILPRALSQVNWLELMLCLCTLIIILFVKRVKKNLPSTLIALVITTCIAVFGQFNYRAIAEIPSGLPIPRLDMFLNFDFGTLSPYLFTAVTLALLGCVDSLLTSVVADNMTKTRHNPKKELIGQGIGNTIAALFGGLPGAGATVGTVINIKSGSKTKLSGMIAGTVLLIVMLLCSPVASQIPAAVLAGILISVGFDVMDIKGIKAIPSMPKSEVAILITVLLLSTFWNLVYAVGIGILIATILFMKKIGDLTSEDLEIVTISESAYSDGRYFPRSVVNNQYVVELSGPLFFGSTDGFQAMTDKIPINAETILIRMEKMLYIDQSGIMTLQNFLLEQEAAKRNVVIINIPEESQRMLTNNHIIPDIIDPSQIYPDFDNYLDHLIELKQLEKQKQQSIIKEHVYT